MEKELKRAKNDHKALLAEQREQLKDKEKTIKDL